MRASGTPPEEPEEQLCDEDEDEAGREAAIALFRALLASENRCLRRRCGGVWIVISVVLVLAGQRGGVKCCCGCAAVPTTCPRSTPKQKQPSQNTRTHRKSTNTELVKAVFLPNSAPAALHQLTNNEVLLGRACVEAAQALLCLLGDRCSTTRACARVRVGGEGWRGVERSGEEWRGVERSGEEWRGEEWSVEVCGVWSVGCGVWSVECGVWSVECGVWRVEFAVVELHWRSVEWSGVERSGAEWSGVLPPLPSAPPPHPSLPPTRTTRTTHSLRASPCSRPGTFGSGAGPPTPARRQVTVRSPYATEVHRFACCSAWRGVSGAEGSRAEGTGEWEGRWAGAPLLVLFEWSSCVCVCVCVCVRARVHLRVCTWS